MTNQEMLISYINKLTEDEISSLLEDVALILETKEAERPGARGGEEDRGI